MAKSHFDVFLVRLSDDDCKSDQQARCHTSERERAAAAQCFTSLSADDTHLNHDGNAAADHLVAVSAVMAVSKTMSEGW